MIKNKDWRNNSLFPFWDLPKNKSLNKRARELRKQGILSEVIFWNLFKGKDKLDGWDIDRQVVIGNYIVDFFIAELGLVIEIDGSSHNGKQADDSVRENYLIKLKLKIVRFNDLDIKNNLDRVYIEFMKIIRDREAELKSKIISNS